MYTVDVSLNISELAGCAIYTLPKALESLANNIQLLHIHHVSRKKAKLFSSYICQLSINFDDFRHRDGQDDKIM